ncbi:MAG TPA: DUF2059 domain-containing protein [Gammaproteobacteria bacterium]|nr:DUF2059 domain-containing protein [Gammaproteobacteria bacterium]
MYRKYLTSLLLAALILPVPAFSAPASKESIRKMMIEAGSGKIGVQIMNQMIPAMKRMIPKAPDKFWKDVMAEVNENEMIELVIPVYQKYLTEEDIKGINAFYASAAGKKLIKVQPAILRESILIGRQWGQQIARKILLKYQQKNHKQSRPLNHEKKL